MLKERTKWGFPPVNTFLLFQMEVLLGAVNLAHAAIASSEITEVGSAGTLNRILQILTVWTFTPHRKWFTFFFLTKLLSTTRAYTGKSYTAIWLATTNSSHFSQQFLLTRSYEKIRTEIDHHIYKPSLWLNTTILHCHFIFASCALVGRNTLRLN